MREKIIGQDFSVLYICLSNKWSTLERKAIFDASYIRDIGGSPTILCYKNSQVDLEAQKEDIATLYIAKKKIISYFDISLAKEIKSNLSFQSYDVVHCYHVSYLWFVAFILKSDLRIPLFVTLNHHNSYAYSNVIAKWLLKRVDRIFTLSEEVRSFVVESFSLAPVKVENLGAGVDVLNRTKELVQDEKRRVISFVINNITEIKYIQFMIRAFRALQSIEIHRGQDLNLYIFLGPKIYQSTMAKRVLTELEHEFYKEDVYLYEQATQMGRFKATDVFVGVSFDEPVNDYELQALMSGACILFPRTAARQSLLFKHKWLGESYARMDMRECVAKLSKILKNYSIYSSSVKDGFEMVCAAHGVELYVSKLHTSYEQSIAKRHRFEVSKKR